MGKLVLIRHGESIWNMQNRFTGWIDVSLSKKGLHEARRAGTLLKNIKFDIAFSSNLLRAQETLFQILNRNNFCNGYIHIHENGKEWYSHYKSTEKDSSNLKVYTSEALNERYYGDLQGLNKEEVKKKFGEKLIHTWRRSFKTPPPKGNSLKATYDMTIPYFKKYIEPHLKKNINIIISAHGNSLRAIIKYIEKIPDDKITQVELETGMPYIYDCDSKGKIKKKIFT